MLDQVPADRRAIVNFHCPPYGSGLDVAPELDEKLRPVLRGGRPELRPRGQHGGPRSDQALPARPSASTATSTSRARPRRSATLCLNPGSDYTADLLRGAVVDIAEGLEADLDFLFTAG